MNFEILTAIIEATGPKAPISNAEIWGGGGPGPVDDLAVQSDSTHTTPIQPATFLSLSLSLSLLSV